MLIARGTKVASAGHRFLLIGSAAMVMIGCSQPSSDTQEGEQEHMAASECDRNDGGVMPCDCIESVSFDEDIKQTSQADIDKLLDLAIAADDCARVQEVSLGEGDATQP